MRSVVVREVLPVGFHGVRRRTAAGRHHRQIELIEKLIFGTAPPGITKSSTLSISGRIIVRVVSAAWYPLPDQSAGRACRQGAASSEAEARSGLPRSPRGRCPPTALARALSDSA